MKKFIQCTICEIVDLLALWEVCGAEGALSISTVFFTCVTAWLDSAVATPTRHQTGHTAEFGNILTYGNQNWVN